MTIEIIVLGPAVGKARPRSAKRGNHITLYTPKETVTYENLVKMAAVEPMRGRALFCDAVDVALTIHVAPPESWSQKKKRAALADEIRPTTKPDADNVLKAIADALNGVVWADDKQITDVVIKKRYSETPKAIIHVRAAGNCCL